MDLKSYIAETERVYNYRVRTVCILDDDAMDRLERSILKYCPVDITRPRKLMLQSNPLDFTNVHDAAEVYVTDLVLSLPASSYVLTQEIRKALAAVDGHVIVRGYNDPNEVESERLVAAAELAAEAGKDGLTRQALLTDPNYSEATTPPELYGDGYNAKFLDYLRTVQKDRQDANHVDPENSLFSWLDMPKSEAGDEGEFNKDIEGAPRLGKAGGPTNPDDLQSNQGNLTDRKRSYKRLYGKKGVRTLLAKDMDTTKDPK